MHIVDTETPKPTGSPALLRQEARTAAGRMIAASNILGRLSAEIERFADGHDDSGTLGNWASELDLIEASLNAEAADLHVCLERC